MAWTPEDPRVATSIGRIDHFFDDLDGTIPGRSLKYKLEILDQNSEVMRRRSGVETPNLTSAQISGILDFLDNRRVQFPDDLGISLPNTVGRIVHWVVDLDGTVSGKQILYRVQEIDSIGQHVQWYPSEGTQSESGFLSLSEQIMISNFMDTQRQKAEDLIL